MTSSGSLSVVDTQENLFLSETTVFWQSSSEVVGTLLQRYFSSQWGVPSDFSTHLWVVDFEVSTLNWVQSPSSLFTQ